jgi:hypothetical protein
MPYTTNSPGRTAYQFQGLSETSGSIHKFRNFRIFERSPLASEKLKPWSCIFAVIKIIYGMFISGFEKLPQTVKSKAGTPEYIITF